MQGAKITSPIASSFISSFWEQAVVLYSTPVVSLPCTCISLLSFSAFFELNIFVLIGGSYFYSVTI